MIKFSFVALKASEQNNRQSKTDEMQNESLKSQLENKSFEAQIVIGDDIFASKSLLDSIFAKGAKKIKIFFNVKKHNKVNKGDVIGELYGFMPKEQWWAKDVIRDEWCNSEINICSHKDGFICNLRDDEILPDYDLEQTKICSIKDNEVEIVENEYKGDCMISEEYDEFTSNIKIQSASLVLYFGQILILTIKYFDNKKILNIGYFGHDIPLIKGDSVSFLFEDGNILNYTITSNPIKSAGDNKFKYCDIVLKCDDIDCFSNYALKAIRFDTNKAGIVEGQIHKLGNAEYDTIIKKQILKQIFINYKHVLESKGLYNDVVEDTPISSETTKETCYVYIMKDEKNGCHKIGISNRPEYREKTLQSDKPFIVMLQAKEFPSRKMARAFESALHSTYSEKNIRGEWFDLSPEEVDEVINALK